MLRYIGCGVGNNVVLTQCSLYIDIRNNSYTISSNKHYFLDTDRNEIVKRNSSEIIDIIFESIGESVGSFDSLITYINMYMSLNSMICYNDCFAFRFNDIASDGGTAYLHISLMSPMFCFKHSNIYQVYDKYYALVGHPQLTVYLRYMNNYSVNLYFGVINTDDYYMISIDFRRCKIEEIERGISFALLDLKKLSIENKSLVGDIINIDEKLFNEIKEYVGDSKFLKIMMLGN